MLSSQTACEGYNVCNWNRLAANQSECDGHNVCLRILYLPEFRHSLVFICFSKSTGGYFCAVCDNGYDCVEVPAADQAECGSKVACFHANGAVTMENTSVTCQSKFSCEGGMNSIVL